MPTRKQRILNTLIVTIVLASLGLLAGDYIASRITERVTQLDLDHYATRLMTGAETSSDLLRTELNAIDASPASGCSEAEIVYLRSLIFESDVLKDAGRIRDGKIQCSALLGISPKSGASLQPQYAQQDGSFIDTNPEPYRNAAVTMLAFGRDESYVVYTPLTQMYLQPPPMHFVQTAMNAPTQKRGRVLGESLNAPPEIFAADGDGHIGDIFYSTRCSIRFYHCFTAYESVHDVATANRLRYDGCVALSGIAGAIAGLLLSILYRRNKNMEQQLRRAIRQNKLRVVYQPIVELNGARIVGAEALARWQNEEGKTISPDIFIHLAEEQGFVGEITELVIDRVLRDFQPVFRAHPDFRVSINVAAADLANPEFPALLERAFQKAGVSPSNIVIELTEGSTMSRSTVIDTIHLLRARGHRVHIDDFGTGYSSLAYLKDLSVDAIKIDKSFTQAIGTGSVTVSILPQILSMAETLGLAVVVEGVETSEQAGYFAASDRKILGQGWLFGRPLPLPEFQRIFAEDKKRTPPGDIDDWKMPLEDVISVSHSVNAA